MSFPQTTRFHFITPHIIPSPSPSPPYLLISFSSLPYLFHFPLILHSSLLTLPHNNTTQCLPSHNSSLFSPLSLSLSLSLYLIKFSMASSHDLASIHPWTFQTTFPDCAFFPHSFSYDYHDSLTLTKSLTATTTPDTFLNNLVNPETTPSSTVSDQEPPPKRHKNTAVSATGKVTKRKSRASKRSLTTYITADPLNFRQMVQQVTGVRPENSHVPMPQILKPEPHRPRSRLPPGDLFLPTLDTSSPFLLDRQDEVVGSTAPAAGPHVPELPVAVVEAAVAPALEFDAYLSYFPTLESW